MEVKHGVRPGGAIAGRPGEAGRMLALLQERLEESRDMGQPILKLEPGDVRRLCEAAEVETNEMDLFRVLVRQNLVRLRGRWRENRSVVRAPVYVERLTEAGLRELRGSGWEDSLSSPDRPPEGGRT